MNIENLRVKHQELLGFMVSEGYSKDYISQIRREIKRILTKASAKKWNSYIDVYREYESKAYSKGHLHRKRVILGLIEHFDVYGQYPDRQPSRCPLVRYDNYHLLSSEFKAAIDTYQAAERARGIKESTIYSNSSNAASFLLELQKKGITSFQMITEEAVLSSFVSHDGSLHRCYGYKKNIAAVFRACVPCNPEVFSRILTYLPAIKNSRKNPKYLLPEEFERIKQVLTNEHSPISLRDKAIGTLALYTGLRSCDIAGLKNDSIDWDNDLIRISQQKTGIPLELPLITVVGNAIYDYLIAERPKTDYNYIFITHQKPYRRLKTDSLTDISVKIMDAAVIRDSKGGFRVFRHHLATSLLGNGVAQPVISRILGHTSPASLNPYLSADFSHLKKCALSVERFPIGGEVLHHA